MAVCLVPVDVGLFLQEGTGKASQGPYQLLGTVTRQAVFDVTTGRCVASDTNLTRTVLTRHQTLSDSEVKVYPLPLLLYVLCHRRTTVSYSRPQL